MIFMSAACHEPSSVNTPLDLHVLVLVRLGEQCQLVWRHALPR